MQFDTEAENLPDLAADGPCSVLVYGEWRRVVTVVEYASPIHGRALSITWDEHLPAWPHSVVPVEHVLTVADDACTECGLPGHTYRERTDDGEWTEDCTFRPFQPVGAMGAARLRAWEATR